MELAFDRTRAVQALMGLTVLLLLASLGVRGVEGQAPRAPGDGPGDQVEVPEPMQLLAKGAALRVDELTAFVADSRLGDWTASAHAPFDLEGCPPLHQWINTQSGQHVERLIGGLRLGTPQEGLAALALIFQIARATEWDPGFMARTQHAERLGGMLEDWLRVWADPAATDPLLYEPAIAAALVYGRVMRVAYNSPALRRKQGPYDQAKAFLEGLIGASGERTPFGRALAQRCPGALSVFLEKSDCLEGFDAQARSRYPELDGECGP